MAKVTYDYSKASPFIKDDEVRNIIDQANAARELLLSGKGAGSDGERPSCFSGRGERHAHGAAQGLSAPPG